jgi:hypothetical protein
MSVKRLFIFVTACILLLAANSFGAGVSGAVTGEGAGIEVTVTGTCATNIVNGVTDGSGNFAVTWDCNGNCSIMVLFNKNHQYTYSIIYDKCDTTVVDAAIAPEWTAIPSMTQWGWIVLILAIILISGYVVMRRRRATT